MTIYVKVFLSLTAITIVFAVTIWALFILNPTSEYQASFSNYGTFLSGTLGIVFAAINTFFLVYFWHVQKVDSLKQEVESRFFNLLTIRNQMRKEIKQLNYIRETINKEYVKEYFPERGNDALNSLAESLYDTQRNSPTGESQKERAQKLYFNNGEYLRHYFDFILFVMEYIDKQSDLSFEQKKEFINVIKADSSYNEMLVWKLMEYDYEDHSISQTPRLKKLEEKYAIFEGKVHTRNI